MLKFAILSVKGNFGILVLIQMWKKVPMRRYEVIAGAATKFPFPVNFVKMMRSFVTIRESFFAAVA